MKTLDYINYRNSSEHKMEDWFNEQNWAEANEGNALLWIQEVFKMNQEKEVLRLTHNYDGNIKNVIISLGCDSPNIVKTRRIRHDGTLLFVQEAVRKMFEDIVFGFTYSYSNCPENYEDNIFKYTTHYKLCDLLWHRKYLDHVSEKEGKMFPGQQDTFACAVGIEYILNE